MLTLSLRRILMWYAVALAVSFLTGAVLTMAHTQPAMTPPTLVPDVSPWDLFTVIARANGKLWAFMSLGVVAFGSVGLVALVGNGLRFGMDVTALALAAPGELFYLLPHASLEFTGFLLAAAACQFLGVRLFAVLVLDRPAGPLRTAIWANACSLLLLFAAALVETASAAGRAG